MKNILLLILIQYSSASISAQINNELPGFILNGEVDIRTIDTLDIEYVDITGKMIQDSIVTNKGKFLLKGHIGEPTVALLHIRGKGKSYKVTTNIFIEPTTMKIWVNKDDLPSSNLFGSHTQDEYDSLNRKEMLIINEASSLKNADRLAIQKEQIKNLEFSFISTHPNSYLSPYLMERYANSLYRDTLKYQYEELTQGIKNSLEGKKIYAYLQTPILLNRNPKIGDFAPDFNEKNINGEEIQLSSYKGKSYVLIDFWASWCSPCIALLPKIKELYAKYHLMGLEVIGVSFDFTQEIWRKSVAKENITQWKNIFPKRIELSNECQLLSDYGVTAIPSLFLINKEGMVIGIFKDENDIEKDLNDSLDKIFK